MGTALKMGWEPTLAGRECTAAAMNLAECVPAMPRVRLLVMGVVLGLLALLPGAQGQGRPEAAAPIPLPKVRVLAIARTPLADERLPEGGLIVALVNASLSQTGLDGSARPDIDVRWTTAGLVRTLLSDPSIDMTLPLNGADCERPNDLSHTSAVLCDQATYSDPILRVVMGLFAPSGSAFKFDTDESILGKRICLAQDYDLSSLNGEGRNWASEQRVVVLRQPTLLDCIVAVQGSKADAFAATDLEGRHLLGRLGLQELFAMGERPLATLSLHAVVSSEHPRGPELLDALNRGLEQLRQSKAYAAIVQKHLMGRWHAPGDIPAIAVAAAAPVTKSSAEGPLPPVEPLARNTSKIAPPVMLPVDRERALRFLKRGDEELAEGRVAAARQLYERAAEMGLAQAAMALAGTYDAAELTGPYLRNVQPNITEARRWYERARALGANDADRRLLRLGAR
jgi:hypothetical protein